MESTSYNISPKINMPVSDSQTITAVFDPLLIRRSVFKCEIWQAFKTGKNFPMFVEVSFGQFF